MTQPTKTDLFHAAFQEKWAQDYEVSVGMKQIESLIKSIARSIAVAVIQKLVADGHLVWTVKEEEYEVIEKDGEPTP